MVEMFSIYLMVLCAIQMFQLILPVMKHHYEMVSNLFKFTDVVTPPVPEHTVSMSTSNSSIPSFVGMVEQIKRTGGSGQSSEHPRIDNLPIYQADGSVKIGFASDNSDTLRFVEATQMARDNHRAAQNERMNSSFNEKESLYFGKVMNQDVSGILTTENVDSIQENGFDFGPVTAQIEIDDEEDFDYSGKIKEALEAAELSNAQKRDYE